MNSEGSESPVESGEQAREPGLFQCGSCQKTYTRLDHLRRHVRGHTNEQPYTCEVCTKSFARQDLLKRHNASHYPNYAKNRNKRLRKADTNLVDRVTRACGPCSKSKLKCEEEKPCRRCVKKKISCVLASEQSLEGPNRDAPPTVLSGESSSPPPARPGLDEKQVAARSIATVTNIPIISHEDDSITRTRQPLQVSGLDGSGVLEYDGTFFPDFLYDVVIPAAGNELTADAPGYLSQAYTPRGFMDYGFDGSIDLSYFDFDFLNEVNLQPDEQDTSARIGQQDPSNVLAIGAEAFQRSTLASWTPGQRDHGFAEQANFRLPQDIADSPELQLNFNGGVFKDRLTQPSRDQIMAMVLEGCRDINIPNVLSSFPTAELLHNLIENFFKGHWAQVYSWIHLPSFRLSEKKPELLASIVAAGALRTSMPIFRKLGFALQEAVRLSIPKRFDLDNTKTRDLSILQGYFLHLDIGLWSGNRRKIEMAESFSQPGVTVSEPRQAVKHVTIAELKKMLRRARRFHRSAYSATPPTTEDDEKIVEQKWRDWTEQESMKRLVYHCFIRDAQTSMALSTNPVMSYAEVNLPLPAAFDLWEAETAIQWRDRYLSKGSTNRLPSLVEAIQDMSQLTKFQAHIDTQLSGLIVLHGIWALIWEHHQCDSISKGSEYWNPLVLNSRYRELSQLLQHFRLNSSEWVEPPQSHVTLMLELVSMHLHMPLEELQLYAGKEDRESARKVNDSARQWISSSASRSAVCHAGKVIQAAKTFPTGLLRDFYAIAVYQAGLAFWSYAVVSRVHNKNLTNASSTAPPMSVETSTRNFTSFAPIVWLDASEVKELEKFVLLGRGDPGICYFETSALLSDSVGIMSIIRDILRNNCAGELPPPLVENLSQLLYDLGQAARAG